HLYNYPLTCFMKKYNNYCRICRNQKHWDNIFDERVRQMLSEKKDGKRITVRLTKRIESKLSSENISQLVLRLLAHEAAKVMSIIDDEDLFRRRISVLEEKVKRIRIKNKWL